MSARAVRIAVPVLLACVFFVAAPAGAADPADTKEISLEWMFKKEDLGVEDPSEFLPGGYRWSPQGHLLAFGQKTEQFGRILVVLDADVPGERVVLTGAQLREVLDELDEHPDGMAPPSRLDYALAIAPAAEPEDDAALEDADPEAGTEEGEQDEDEDKDSIRSYSWMKNENRIRIRFDEQRLQFDPVAYKIFPDPQPDLPQGDREILERSPDDRYAAYMRDHDLYVFDFENRKELRLTDSGSETVLNGKYPWVYWEEMMWRRTYRAYWWRPQGDAIAFLQFDEEGVSEYPVTDFSSVVPETYTQRYPKVGTRNPSVRLGIVSLSSRETRWVDLGEPHEYIINVDWMPDGSALSVQTMNRRQDRLGLYRVDRLTARGELVLEETSETWVDPFDSPRFLEQDDGFVWLSERSGYRHLYRATNDGKLAPLTSGEWVVEQPGFGGRSIHLDEAAGRVYFRGTRESAIERHVYWVALRGGKPKRISREPGWHSTNFAKDGAYWIDSWSSVDVPRRVDLRDRDGREVARLVDLTPEDHAPYRFGKPELLNIKGKGGMVFHGSLLKPFDFDPDKRYPVVAHVYGEPAGQDHRNRFVSAFDMVLANHGFLVFRFDARGTPGRGRPWLDPIHKNQMELPMEDWRVAVDWLKAQPFVDGDRLGVWGWSGGGTMTLNLMLRTPGLFHAGAAGGAVTDKRLYDTIYTERYLGTLADNEEGYEASSPLFAADKLEGELLIAHGVSDDNVHVQNAYNLISALSEAGKDYQLYLYPQSGHGVSGDDLQFHLNQRILEFFVSALKP
jgi:dipeptidyl-peptidase-4